jgi:hypothetical protein
MKYYAFLPLIAIKSLKCFQNFEVPFPILLKQWFRIRAHLLVAYWTLYQNIQQSKRIFITTAQLLWLELKEDAERVAVAYVPIKTHFNCVM